MQVSKTRLTCLKAFVGFMMVLVGATNLHAINTQLFRPNIAPNGTFRLSGSKALEPGKFTLGLFLNFADDTLVLQDTGSGTLDQKLATWVFTQDLMAEVGIIPRLTLGFDLPLHLVNHSDIAIGSPYSTDYALGDILIYGRVMILDPETAPLGLALVPFIEAPSGKSDYYVGDAGVNYGAKAVADKRWGRFYANLNVGYRGHGKQELVAGGASVFPVDINDEFTYGVGASYAAVQDRLDLIVDALGTTTFKDFASRENSAPIEVDGGVRAYFMDKAVALNIGGGAGIRNGYGSPRYRIFTGLTFQLPMHKDEPAPKEEPKPKEIKKIVLSGVNFVTNKSDLTPEAKRILDRNYAELSQDSKLVISVEGHADDVGTDAYNQKLSERRAAAVLTYLSSKGFPADHIRSAGYGESKPLVPNTSKENRAMNRRVEVRLLDRFEK